jgi:thiol-disulfide isomerase/thioredoxin
MKKIAWLPLMLAALSCANRTYQVNGIYSAPDGTEVYLIDSQASDTLGVTTVTDGKFAFSGTVKTPTYAYVGQGRERIHFILEPGVVTADINERVGYGTPMEDAYQDFHRKFYGFSRDQKELKVALADSVVRANPSNLLGALALEDLYHVDKDRFIELFDVVAPEVKDFYLVQSVYKDYSLLQATAPGQLFTDYLIPGGNPDGTDVRLSDYVGQGKCILLDHWASWCGPCKKEMPYIKKTWEAFHGDRFDVVSIAISDKRENTLEALSQLDMPWNQILDGGKIPQGLYGISTIPHLILFGPDGTILARGLRGEEIYTAVESVLASR